MVLAVIMFGLGMSLTVADFARVARYPKAAAIALICQLMVLPLVAFGLASLLDLPPLLAVGMMLLAASPGGTSANLFSHLFKGDVALNVTLTAVNSALAVVTLPLITNFALDHFHPARDNAIGLQFGKVVQIFALVLIPVAIGLLVRRLRPEFALRMDRPVRIGSVAVLALVILGALFGERSNATGYVIDAGVPAIAFCVASLSIGYFVPRALGVSNRQSISCSMEIGIHNSALAITIAIGLLGETGMAIPAAVYGIAMFPIAFAAGWLITRTTGTARRVDTASTGSD